MEKPLIVCVDDDSGVLSELKDLLDCPDYIIKTFSSPLEALKSFSQREPEVVISDQKMPELLGSEFLNLVKRSYPEIKRIIMTGTNDSNLYDELVNENLCDFVIHKPFHPINVKFKILSLLSRHKTEKQNRDMLKMIKESKAELEKKNKELSMLVIKEKMAQKELKCWMHPLIYESIFKEQQIPDIISIAGICFDIIGSSQRRGTMLEGKSLRHLVLEKFVQKLLQYGGWQESHGGDSGYGYFKADDMPKACQLALSAAKEFRLAITNLNDTHSQDVRISIGLHMIPGARLKVIEAEAIKFDGRRQTQKCIVTFSEDIDLLHRIESMGHFRDEDYPGIPILLSEQFTKQLLNAPGNIKLLGQHKLSGITKSVGVYLLPDETCPSAMPKFA